MNFADMAALNAALPGIIAAPTIKAMIDFLCFRPDFCQRTYPDQIPVTRAGGIAHKRWRKKPWLTLPDGSSDPSIQDSILGLRVYHAVVSDTTAMPHPSDTIIADLDCSDTNMPKRRC